MPHNNVDIADRRKVVKKFDKFEKFGYIHFRIVGKFDFSYRFDESHLKFVYNSAS